MSPAFKGAEFIEKFSKTTSSAAEFSPKPSIFIFSGFSECTETFSNRTPETLPRSLSFEYLECRTRIFTAYPSASSTRMSL